MILLTILTVHKMLLNIYQLQIIKHQWKLRELNLNIIMQWAICSIIKKINLEIQ
jgi:hypothetical protein